MRSGCLPWCHIQASKWDQVCHQIWVPRYVVSLSTVNTQCVCYYFSKLKAWSFSLGIQWSNHKWNMKYMGKGGLITSSKVYIIKCSNVFKLKSEGKDTFVNSSIIKFIYKLLVLSRWEKKIFLSYFCQKTVLWNEISWRLPFNYTVQNIKPCLLGKIEHHFIISSVTV